MPMLFRRMATASAHLTADCFSRARFPRLRRVRKHAGLLHLPQRPLAILGAERAGGIGDQVHLESQLASVQGRLPDAHILGQPPKKMRWTPLCRNSSAKGVRSNAE